MISYINESLEVNPVDMLLQIDELLPLKETDQFSTGEIVWCALSKQEFNDANAALKKQ